MQTTEGDDPFFLRGTSSSANFGPEHGSRRLDTAGSKNEQDESPKIRSRSDSGDVSPKNEYRLHISNNDQDWTFD